MMMFYMALWFGMWEQNRPSSGLSFLFNNVSLVSPLVASAASSALRTVCHTRHRS